MATRTALRRSSAVPVRLQDEDAAGPGRRRDTRSARPRRPPERSWERSRERGRPPARGHGADAARRRAPRRRRAHGPRSRRRPRRAEWAGPGSTARHAVRPRPVRRAGRAASASPSSASGGVADAEPVGATADDDDEQPEPAPEPDTLRVGVGLDPRRRRRARDPPPRGDRPAARRPLDDLRDAGGVSRRGRSARRSRPMAGTVGAAIFDRARACSARCSRPACRCAACSPGRPGARWLGRQARAFTELARRRRGDADDRRCGVDATAPVDVDPYRSESSRHRAGSEEPEVAELYDVEPTTSTTRRRSRPTSAHPSTCRWSTPAAAGRWRSTSAPKSGRTGAWKLPPTSLLKRSDGKGVDARFVEEGGKVLEATLHQHGVDAQLVGMTIGPTVTRYELELAPGVKVNRVTNLSHDIAYAMASPDVRILAPIPGRSAIGVEVPNRQRQLVTLGDILARRRRKCRARTRSRSASGATSPVARDMLNLATLPHVLIAGATGAGKSSCINSLVTSLLMRNTPEQVRLILVDPKRGRARRVQRPAAPPHAGRHEPEEGGERARLGRARDGHALRDARRGRRPRHHRLQRGVRPRRAAHAGGARSDHRQGLRAAAVHRRSSSTSSTT